MDREAIWAEYHAALTAEWREMPAHVREAIPAHLRGGLDRYIVERIRPGAFLTAILTNDLAGTVARMNPPLSLVEIRHVLEALHNYAPGTCYGDPEKVADWLMKGEKRTEAPATGGERGG